MAPTIEKLKTRLDHEIEMEEMISEIHAQDASCEINRRDIGILTKRIHRVMEEIFYNMNSPAIPPHKILRDTLCSENSDSRLKGDNVELRVLKILEKEKRFGTKKTCFLGFTMDYECFKEKFPYMCNRYSERERPEGSMFGNRWPSFKEGDINGWDPRQGEIQFIDNTGNLEKDKIILAIEFDKKSLLGGAILEMNKAGKIFKEEN